jgi:mRNA interferase HicA
LKGSEFLRKLTRLARRKGIDLKRTTRGKGSHQTLYLEGRKATLPDAKKELKPGTFRAICAQLGIDPRELE